MVFMVFSIVISGYGNQNLSIILNQLHVHVWVIGKR